jgi:hypothetical protein
VSLYREARSGRRRLWLAAGVSVLVLAVAAGVVWATSGSAPSQKERLESLQDDVQPALAALELIPIHYESPNRTTHAAAAEQLDVAREAIESVEDELRALDPARTRRLLAELAHLELLVRTTGRTDRVEELTRETTSNLRELVRLDRPG